MNSIKLKGDRPFLAPMEDIFRFVLIFGQLVSFSTFSIIYLIGFSTENYQLLNSMINLKHHKNYEN